MAHPSKTGSSIGTACPSKAAGLSFRVGAHALGFGRTLLDSKLAKQLKNGPGKR